MLITTIVSVILAFLALRLSANSVENFQPEGLFRAAEACKLLEQKFPDLVSFPGKDFLLAGTVQFVEDNDHAAVSSEQNSTCSIQPSTTDVVSTVVSKIQIIGKCRAPFAVKSGGHAYNLGQSSTPGVQISMERFADINYDANRGTVSIGVGLRWLDVYKRLEPLGIMVAGGRINEVGVGGYSLGGGYSWKTNQFGLLIDTVVSFRLVLPSGKPVHVTSTSDPDLFFALKGGLNNFGLVTDIEVEAHNQSLVFGGILQYSLDSIDSLNSAISNFSTNNRDPRAQIIPVYVSLANQFIGLMLLFYDGPTPPPGVYDEILSIPAVASDVNTQTFVDFMLVAGKGDIGIGSYGIAQHTVPIVNYTKPILDEMVTQVNTLGARLTEQNNGSLVVVVMSPEPLLDPFSHSRGGAYPHPPTRQITPSSPYIAYQEDPNTPLAVRTVRQAGFVNEIKAFTRKIQAKAVQEGQSSWEDIHYPNYALPDTPLGLVYGQNVPRLRELAAKYDPDKIMTLTGGFKFQSLF